MAAFWINKIHTHKHTHSQSRSYFSVEQEGILQIVCQRNATYQIGVKIGEKPQSHTDTPTEHQTQG